MITASILALGSITALALLFSRHGSEAITMSVEEAKIRTQGVSFWHDFFGSAYDHAVAYWRQVVRPQFLGFLAKRVGWFRVFVLRFEQQLFKLAHRIRSSSALSPKPSEYWQNVHAWKNANGNEILVHQETEAPAAVVAVSAAPIKKRRGPARKNITASFALEHVEAAFEDRHL